MPNGDKSIGLLFLALLVLIVIINAVIATKVFQPPPPPKGPLLNIDDEHWATWMPIDNGFTKEGLSDPSYTYWNGVLIQLGVFWTYTSGGTSFPVPTFANVVINGSTGARELANGQFKWINIVSEWSGANPPINFDKIGLLYPHPGTTTVACAEVDACAQTGGPCLCETPPCPDASALEPIPKECVRLRSIHSHFQPTALITYWQGPGGYRLIADRSANGGEHNHYTFRLLSPVRIEVYQASGAIEIVDVGDVHDITVYGPPGGDHGEIHDIGLDGGELGLPPS